MVSDASMPTPEEPKLDPLVAAAELVQELAAASVIDKNQVIAIHLLPAKIAAMGAFVVLILAVFSTSLLEEFAVILKQAIAVSQQITEPLSHWTVLQLLVLVLTLAS
jgi:hypothetical protein